MNDHQNYDKNDKQKTGSKRNILIYSTENFIKGHVPTNILLAVTFAVVIYFFYKDYNDNHRFSSMLVMMHLCLISLFFLIRKTPGKISKKPIDWAAAILGTFIILFIAPVPAQNEIAPLMLLQIFGIFVSIIATINLNTSIALIPAVREIKTGGLYNLIRHPLYLGFFITFTCLALQNFTMLNVVILAAIYAMNIHRIKAEEEILSENTNYQLYKMRVRWRLLPFIW